MSNNSVLNIRTALNTHLSAVTELKQVVIGRSLTFTGYPACRFYLLGIEDKQEDQQANFRSYKFAIEIIQEISNKDKDDAEADFQDAVDAVLDKLNSQWKMPNGSNVPQVDTSKIEVGNVQQLEFPFGPAVVLRDHLLVQNFDILIEYSSSLMSKKPEIAAAIPGETKGTLQLFTVLINGIDFAVLARDKEHLSEIVEKMRKEMA